MTTEDQAATCIQARFRGVQCREKQRRSIRAVTKLQALQRGRFTRREFAKLRDFSREQEGFQQATRRRQIRIWRNEQELYFLQHTNAADLERVRAFQQQHSARVIQRTWRATNRIAVPVNETRTEILNPNDRVYLFDPFGLAPHGPARFDHWVRDKENVKTSQSSPSLLVSGDDIRATVVNQKLFPAVADADAFAKRRKAIQERIKRLVAQQKSKEDSIVKKPKIPRSSNVTEGSKVQSNRRRELYEKVMEMKYATAQRVLRYDRETRASRPQRELLSAKLVVSCENRIKHLRMETPDQLAPSKEDNQLDDIIDKWGEARRVRAWNHHRRAVCSVLEKRHWWQTQLAGEQRDIRHVVVAKSPWEDENNIWVWPRSESNNQREARDGTAHASSSSVWPSVEIHSFLVGDYSSKETQNPSLKVVGDEEASEWWRAHCTQSHLASNGALQIQNPYTAEFSNNVTNEGDVYPVCTPEVVANRDLYELQQRAKSAARTKSLERDIEQRVKNLTAQVERRVHEMEVQVESNTQLALEIVKRKQEQRARISREQQAATTIQRHARGMQGRRCARERRAEFFVMVRGRAIRRGRCEECGDERAVLECQQCEESVHFCPLCWVHVHSTRRRKTHVAIPMTTAVAPAPVHEITKPQVVAEASLNSSKAAVVSFGENAGPRLRSLPSPRKQNTTRSAELAPVGLKGSVNGNDRRAKSSKEDSQNTATSTAFHTRKNTAPELAEACALARRVRAELGEAPLAANESGTVREPKSAVHESSADSDDIDFSTVDEDGAAMGEIEVARDEQLAADESSESAEVAVEKPKTAKPSEVVEVQAKIMKSTDPEPLKLPSESHSVHVPKEDFSALPPDTAVFAAAVRNEEQKAKLIAGIPDGSPGLESNYSGENKPVENTPESLSAHEIQPTNEFAPAAAAAAAGADAISNAEPSESQEMPVTVEQVSGVSLTDEAAAGLVHVDNCPSETPVADADQVAGHGVQEQCVLTET